MRLWSLHPKYLDRIGLVALWREALLAKKVLQGKTKGYTNHPQLIRFKNYASSLKAINCYLYYIWLEANKRNYDFDKSKFVNYNLEKIILINGGQIEYEFEHLSKKLKKRDFKKFKEIESEHILSGGKIEVNPLFKLKKGCIENWEIIK